MQVPLRSFSEVGAEPKKQSMKHESEDMDTAPASTLSAAWPVHRPDDLLDRIIVEQWLEAQVALIGPRPSGA